MDAIFTITFWISMSILFYSYVGYGIILYLLVVMKRAIAPQKESLPSNAAFFPAVTVLIAAFNEEDYIIEKIQNTFSLYYPKDKLKVLIVTDGSTDRTPAYVKRYPAITLLHQPQRQGKIAAVQRAMPYVFTDFVVFTDANTMLNKEALLMLMPHFQDESVGAVAGEKRIKSVEKAAANAAGEGAYWKYESTLKRWDAELNSVVGAAGELFCIRKSVFEYVPRDTLIEDFYLTMRIAQKGYLVKYEPQAYALEGPSASISEELKRKIRIATGGIQAITRLFPLLNPVKFGILSFQYFSHRVLRWTLAPVALLTLLLSNVALAWQGQPFYQAVLLSQGLFYMAVLVGRVCETQQLKTKLFFVPYYFFIMNYAVYRGFIRALKGSQSVLWEKAKRA